MSYLLEATLAMANQELASTSEAEATTILAEVLAADGVTVVASTSTAPFKFPGLAEADYVFRASGLDSLGKVMGVPFTVAFTANDAAAGVPPAPTTVAVSLPSGATLTITKE